ncbi:MAG: carotenoid biosynthesis protein [Cytophagales bacterium]|jgi:putative membrane protein|nr:carotenoid biosynthesis protein [Cytophagales bacterium]
MSSIDHPLVRQNATPFGFKVCIYLLVSMHMAGLIGLNWHVTRPLFSLLTPFNLIATAVMLLYCHQPYTGRFWLFAAIAFLAGFLVEVAGVHTGVIFGHYGYGPVLGWKLWEVPLVIGCNWLVLIYATRTVSEKLLKMNWLQPLVAAALMVLIDGIIEPVAMRLDFWSWRDNTVPLRNYVAWFGVSLVLHGVFKALVPVLRNPLAVLVYIVQFLFFLGCLLAGRWLA